MGDSGDVGHLGAGRRDGGSSGIRRRPRVGDGPVPGSGMFPLVPLRRNAGEMRENFRKFDFTAIRGQMREIFEWREFLLHNL